MTWKKYYLNCKKLNLLAYLHVALKNALFSSDSSVVGVPIGIYTFDEFSDAVKSAGHQLNIATNEWSGRKPQDHLLFGFNIGTSFDDKKLNFDFDWNISLYNRNTWG